MNPRPFRRTAVSLGIAVATLTAAVATPAYARPDHVVPAPAAVAASPVFAIVDGVARQVAVADRSELGRLGVSAANGPVDLLATSVNGRLAGDLRAANQRLLIAKGLPGGTGSLLRLRLAHPDMRAALARGESPLVAAAPTDDSATSVNAYDRFGRTVVLDAARVPQRPVLVVDVDTERALSAGLTLMREELGARGFDRAASARPASRASAAGVTASAGYWATKVDAVRLADDKEPWIKGAAEIYNLVAGFGLDGKVKVDLVQMPYLDHDGTTYYPNQLLVHFSSYKYNLADVVMMEDDGDTNYSALVKAIAGALLVIVDGGAYTPLVNAILDALPASWYTDDPDFVDAWYTLSTASSGRKYGAGANGWMDVSRYWVEQL
ncbi:DUF3103 domain-containing protein [Micromonospora peucetia]|uniref:DUF3103 domain-containing protein n=1 Tax=Micromonospora peucetia TaxID=47871 RepID=A0A1C6VLQ9_9ACTN|nr:DUF3103 family protein [Micromonospora peucetia]MCX4388779.1 DUF3103 domain-containing protein [Micromonospora peucetia]SCL67266.1 Protein of unknown function (DUF3103) [Micromonospora peucetia]